MEKPYKIRKIDWNKKINNIPKDFLDIMNFFNKGLKSGKYPYIPRKNNPITKKEILNVWIKNKNNSLSLLAEDIKSKNVVASAVITLHKKGKEGILNISKNSDYNIKGVGTELTKKIIKISLSKNIILKIRTFIKNYPMIKVMEKLGYGQGKLIKKFGIYRGKIKGTNYDVFEWTINPKT